MKGQIKDEATSANPVAAANDNNAGMVAADNTNGAVDAYGAETANQEPYYDP